MAQQLGVVTGGWIPSNYILAYPNPLHLAPSWGRGSLHGGVQAKTVMPDRLYQTFPLCQALPGTSPALCDGTHVLVRVLLCLIPTLPPPLNQTGDRSLGLLESLMLSGLGQTRIAQAASSSLSRLHTAQASNRDGPGTRGCTK